MTRRLPESHTQLINRSKPVDIFYQGKAIPAFEGDTVASALLAAGIDTFSRSFKYHRRRSVSCMSGQCSRCTMNVDGRMHIKTCQTTVKAGMSVEPQGDVDRDLMAVANLFSWAMPTGFYYKTFYKPRWFWKIVKEIIRAAPGNLAKVKPLDKPAMFESVNVTPDILVIGGGLAGMEAAITAAKTGIRVVLAETDAQLGGFEAFQGESGYGRAQDSIQRLKSYTNLTVLNSTHVSAIYPDGMAVCIQACGADEEFTERTYLVRPKATVLATGTISMPMLFEHNDRPGVLLPEAALRMIHLWALSPGQQIVLAGGEDYVARVALQLLDKGVNVSAMIDFRPEGLNTELRDEFARADVPVWNGYTLTASCGRRKITGVKIASLDGSDLQSIKCDTIVASSGRYPKHKLLGQIGARMVYDKALNFYLPQELPANYQVAGRLLGLEDADSIIAQGRLAGQRALASINAGGVQHQPVLELAAIEAPPLSSVARQTILAQDKDKTFVCYCHDVTQGNIEQALAEGFNSIELCKRYTTATQGACQGGMCEANFARLLADSNPALEARVLPTTRPPLTTISLGNLAAGHHDHPLLTPLHDIQLSHGGVPERFGPWIRMMDFGDAEAESLAVHQSAGIYDASILGKFRVYGPDASKLLNRFIINKVDNLTANKLMYFTACNESGVLIDDGTIVKLGEQDYFITNTTSRAPVTEEWLSMWCRGTGWQVNVVNLTDAKGDVLLAGPRARDILSTLTNDDISNETLPFSHWAEISVAGVKVMALRLGFVGELSYELVCPASQTSYLWQRIYEAGTAFGIKPFGIEALNICRLEKGHILPAFDTDGFTTLFEASFGGMLSATKTNTVGQPMLELLRKDERQSQVIALSIDGRSDITDGALVVGGNNHYGHVTSMRYSPLLNKTLGLALVKPHEGCQVGGSVSVWHNNAEVAVQVAKRPFYDVTGERMKL